MEGTKVLAEVDELLDETLTEIGPIEGELSKRVDSVEYQVELAEKIKQREQLGPINYQEQSQHEQNDNELMQRVEKKQEFQFQLEEDHVQQIDPDEV